MDLLKAADSAPANAEVPASPLPPTVPAVLALDPAIVKAIPALTKQSLLLGVHAEIDKLREGWNGEYPQKMPFDPDEVQTNGKRYSTLHTFSQNEKGFKDPVPINTAACNTGISALESLVRVLLGCEDSIGMSEKPFADLAQHVQSSIEGVAPASCTNEDLCIVRMMIGIRGFRCQKGRAARPYFGTDQTVLNVLNKVPDLKSRLERWGFQVAQLFVDVYRTIGEMSALDCWEKRATLTEEVVFAKLRLVGFFYPSVQLDADAFHSLWKRATKE